MPGRYRPRTLRLDDGSPLLLRGIEPADSAGMAEAFSRLSDESRYRRFFVPLAELTPEMLAYLTDVDHVDHEALVAVEPASGRGVAVARYVRSAEDPSVAEVAITVEDDWQGRGVGTLVLDQLAGRARRQGIRRFSALVLAENAAALRLLRSLGETRTTSEGEIVELLIDLPERRAARAALTHLLRLTASGRLVAGAMLRRAGPVTATGAEDEPARAVWPATALRRVLVGADPSTTARRAVNAAAEIAAAAGAGLHLVCAYGLTGETRTALAPQDVPAAASDLAWQVMSEQDAQGALLATASAVTARFPDLVVQTVARHGHPARMLIELAGELEADLLVVGSKGLRSARRLITGSVATAVLRRSPCSVLVVRTDTPS